MTTQGLTGFTQIDQTDNPEFFVNCLDHLSQMQSLQAYKNKTFNLLKVKQGDQILDVGCGTGEDVRNLATLVGNTGLSVGVDSSQIMLEKARERSKDLLNLSVEYHLGDAQNLNFPDETFNGCRAERIFQYLAAPEKALAEMIRVTKPKGIIVIGEPDWGTLAINAPERNLTRRILNAGCDVLANGWIGRQLYALFNQCDLTNITLNADAFLFTNYTIANQIFNFSEAVETAQKTGAISVDEASIWLNSLQELEQSGTFLSAITGFTVSGQKK